MRISLDISLACQQNAGRRWTAPALPHPSSTLGEAAPAEVRDGSQADKGHKLGSACERQASGNRVCGEVRYRAPLSRSTKPKGYRPFHGAAGLLPPSKTAEGMFAVVPAQVFRSRRTRFIHLGLKVIPSVCSCSPSKVFLLEVKAWRKRSKWKSRVVPTHCS
jgi:hypothetical protein